MARKIKKLSLRRETLRNLTDDEMTSVRGAARSALCPLTAMPTDRCCTEAKTGCDLGLETRPPLTIVQTNFCLTIPATGCNC